MFSVVRSGATSLLRNASRSIAPEGVSNLACRNFSSGGALITVGFGRVAKWNAETLHGGPPKGRDPLIITGGIRKGQYALHVGETEKQYRILY